MPLNVNRVIIAGSLTRAPEIRFLGNDKAVGGFGMAINRKYRGSDGEMKEEVVFIDVECWGRTAELAGKYLAKGRNVHIEGRLKQDVWEDKTDGKKRSKLKVVADTVNFIDSEKRDGQKEGGWYNERPSAPAVPPPADLGDDSSPPF